jgi:hypothetical protein
VSWSGGYQRRVGCFACCERLPAAAAELAASDGFAGLDREDFALAASAFQASWNGVQQGLGVGVARGGQHLVRHAAFNDAAAVHDGDAVADSGDHGEVVTDQDDGQAQGFV